MTDTDLIMELTMEQGPARITQVQPPSGAWGNYFGIDFEDLPTLQITNAMEPDAQIRTRPVVAHDHVWTLEVESANVIRPAIIRFRRMGPNAYSYWLYQYGDVEFAHCRWMLETFPNPVWTKGRRWLII